MSTVHRNADAPELDYSPDDGAHGRGDYAAKHESRETGTLYSDRREYGRDRHPEDRGSRRDDPYEARRSTRDYDRPMRSDRDDRHYSDGPTRSDRDRYVDVNGTREPLARSTAPTAIPPVASARSRSPPRDSRDGRDYRDSREVRDYRDSRDPRDSRVEPVSSTRGRSPSPGRARGGADVPASDRYYGRDVDRSRRARSPTPPPTSSSSSSRREGGSYNDRYRGGDRSPLRRDGSPARGRDPYPPRDGYSRDRGYDRGRDRDFGGDRGDRDRGFDRDRDRDRDRDYDRDRRRSPPRYGRSPPRFGRARSPFVNPAAYGLTEKPRDPDRGVVYADMQDIDKVDVSNFDLESLPPRGLCHGYLRHGACGKRGCLFFHPAGVDVYKACQVKFNIPSASQRKMDTYARSIGIDPRQFQDEVDRGTRPRPTFSPSPDRSGHTSSGGGGGGGNGSNGGADDRARDRHDDAGH